MQPSPGNADEGPLTAAWTTSGSRRSSARGDAAAFEALYDRHHAALLAFCRHMVGNREDGEDALQQAFLRAHKALAERARARPGAPVAVRDRPQPLPHPDRRAARRRRCRPTSSSRASTASPRTSSAAPTCASS